MRDGGGKFQILPKPQSRSKATISKGRQLRGNLSLPEVLLWQELQKRQYSFKFRRQYRLDPYVLDFYCAEVGLDVEIDSAWHDGRSEQDAQRDEALAANNKCVLRILAKDVLDKPDACALWVENACLEVASWRAAGALTGFRTRQSVRYP